MLNSKLLLARAGTLVLAFACVPAWAGTCRVTVAGVPSNDGSAWSVPISLQAALATSGCTEIWVAAGVYKPAPAGNPGISFNVHPGVAVYGGFAGTETLRTDRDIAGNPTVLSGDIDGDDNVDANGVDVTVDTAHNGGNSSRVVTMDGTAGIAVHADTVLDGFFITAANNASGPGGGFYCNGNGGGNECSPTVSNVTFSGNSAQYGGAMFNGGAGSGGTSSPTLSNITFSGNTATGDGGAMYNNGSFGTSNPVLGNVTFSGNSAVGDGGAMVNSGYTGTSEPSLSNVTFSGNFTTVGSLCGGGALYNFFSFPSLKNVILWGDTSAVNATYNEICNANSGPPSTGTPSFTNTVFQGSGGSSAWDNNRGTDLGGNLDADPKLGPLWDNGGSTKTMLPGSGSSAIDHGDAATCSAAPVDGLDQRGVTRPEGAACDIGAVELRVPDRIFADNFDGTPPVQ